jgi:hypothetical protein
MTLTKCHSEWEVFTSTRNLFVIPTEKLFCFDEESICHSDREVFASTRNPIIIPTEKFFSSTRNLLVILTEKFFCFDEESFCFRQAKILQSRKAPSEWHLRNVIPNEKFFYFDEESLCFRQAKILQSLNSSFRMTLTKCHSEWEVFLLWWGIYLSFRQRSFFALMRNLLFQQGIFML